MRILFGDQKIGQPLYKSFPKKNVNQTKLSQGFIKWAYVFCTYLRTKAFE